ncbi:VOC family protein [Nocardia salmonicida]|uniref:VOC family protein n=1 Tax=Nocardia salmonicida TaxID=53431 RepID=UPI0037A14452
MAQQAGGPRRSHHARGEDCVDESAVGVEKQLARFGRGPPEHEPPQFPDPRGSQQLHLDIEVDDIESAQRNVLSLGATRVTDAVGEDNFRVFRDPAGHTFCLVWGITAADN